MAAAGLAEYEWRAHRREFGVTLVVLLGPRSRPIDLDDETVQESVHIDPPCSRDTRALYPHTYRRGLTGQREDAGRETISKDWCASGGPVLQEGIGFPSNVEKLSSRCPRVVA